MERAKFKDMEEQREYFLKVKNILGIGSTKLAKRIGLDSRGAIESYTLKRTSPPIEIIKKIEKVSGIKANYTRVNGKVYRKKREFTPLDPKCSEIILKERFDKDFKYLEKLIKSDKSIKDIIIKIREKGYKFDNSLISKAIGAYRTNLKSRIVENIKPNLNDIIILGYIDRSKNTLRISFNLLPLYRIIIEKETRIGIEFSKDRKRLKIFPLEFGRKLSGKLNRISLLFTEKSDLNANANIEIILSPDDFGFNIIDSIYDKDSRRIAIEALKQGFKLDNYRSTPKNHKGDLSLFYNNRNIILEVTKMKTRQGGYFKVGQCLIQKIKWPESLHFLICIKSFLNITSRNALNEIDVEIINSDFKNNWERKVISELERRLSNEKEKIIRKSRA